MSHAQRGKWRPHVARSFHEGVQLKHPSPNRGRISQLTWLEDEVEGSEERRRGEGAQLPLSCADAKREALILLEPARRLGWHLWSVATASSTLQYSSFHITFRFFLTTAGSDPRRWSKMAGEEVGYFQVVRGGLCSQGKSAASTFGSSHSYYRSYSHMWQ